MYTQQIFCLFMVGLFAGFLIGVWVGSELRRFVMRRNEELAEENKRLRDLLDPADWWKQD